MSRRAIRFGYLKAYDDLKEKYETTISKILCAATFGKWSKPSDDDSMVAVITDEIDEKIEELENKAREVPWTNDEAVKYIDDYEDHMEAKGVSFDTLHRCYLADLFDWAEKRIKERG